MRHLLALLPLQAALVELQLLALQDVPVRAPALPGPGCDSCQQPSSRNLQIKCLQEESWTLSDSHSKIHPPLKR